MRVVPMHETEQDGEWSDTRHKIEGHGEGAVPGGCAHDPPLPEPRVGVPAGEPARDDADEAVR